LTNTVATADAGALVDETGDTHSGPVTQAALGHSTSNVTMDVYAHVTPALQDTVAEATDRALSAADA
jgi:integrase